MDQEYQIRQATLSDKAFVAEIILAAEIGNSKNMGLAKLFNLSEEKLRTLMIRILEEEIDGCDWSISSFLLAEHNGKPVAGLGGWIEGWEDNVSSNTLKANLIGFVFPRENIEFARLNSEGVSDLRFEKEWMTLQLEYVYADKEHRGKRLCQQLIERHMELAKEKFPEIKKAQMQPFTNNTSALKLFERSGFKGVRTYRTENEAVLRYLPHNEKLVMERKFK